jgi:phenylalanine-4-hydroxylase
VATNTPIAERQDPAADFTIDQCWESYSSKEHAIWSALYQQQISVLRERAVPEFYMGLNSLNLNDGGIPDFRRINDALDKLTGWQIVAVPCLVPDEIFFEHLANRRFPAGQFIRSSQQMDYIQEPDIFHDVFGHVPLLAQPVFANYMEAYGKGGLRALKYDCLKNLARLYWYTVEFGLMNTMDGPKIYGAGIVSSRTESVFSVEDPSPNRLHFDLERVMETDYRIDDFQQIYFHIDSFDELFESTQQDFGPIYEYMSQSNNVYGLTDIRPSDRVYTRGTQAYADAGGRFANAS